MKTEQFSLNFKVWKLFSAFC